MWIEARRRSSVQNAGLLTPRNYLPLLQQTSACAHVALFVQQPGAWSRQMLTMRLMDEIQAFYSKHVSRVASSSKQLASVQTISWTMAVKYCADGQVLNYNK